KMAEENVPAPTRTDDQLVPVKARLPIGKSNLLMDLQKMQKNPIFYLSSGVYSFQLDELWFTLDVDLLRSALGITPKDFAHPFVAPPTGDLSISAMENYSIHDQPMLNRQDFWQSRPFSDVANLKVPTKKPKPHVIPYSDDYSLGNLKFIPKRELDEVFGMAIPKDLITDVIRNSEYYQKYLDMAAHKPRQATTVTDEEGGKKKKAPPASKSKKPTPAKQPPLAKQTKLVKEKTSKSSPSKKIHKGKVMKVRKGKRSDH
ncbi:hypothetical protein Tco_1427304, partial [Tanacetum coccineum]